MLGFRDYFLLRNFWNLEDYYSRHDWNNLLPVHDAANRLCMPPSQVDVFHLLECCLALYYTFKPLNSAVSFGENHYFRLPTNQWLLSRTLRGMAEFIQEFALYEGPWTGDIFAIKGDAEYDELEVAEGTSASGSWGGLVEKIWDGCEVERLCSADKIDRQMLCSDDLRALYTDLSNLRRFIIKTRIDDRGGYRDRFAPLISGPTLYKNNAGGSYKLTHHSRFLDGRGTWVEATPVEYDAIGSCITYREYRNGTLHAEAYFELSGGVGLFPNSTSSGFTPPNYRGYLDGKPPNDAHLICFFRIQGSCATPGISFPILYMGFGFDIRYAPDNIYEVINFDPSGIMKNILFNRYARVVPEWAERANRSITGHLSAAFFDTGELNIPSRVGELKFQTDKYRK